MAYLRLALIAQKLEVDLYRFDDQALLRATYYLIPAVLYGKDETTWQWHDISGPFQRYAVTDNIHAAPDAYSATGG